MLDDKVRWLIQCGYLRSKRDIQWIFKRDLIDVVEDIVYNLELSQEELRASTLFCSDATVISTYSHGTVLNLLRAKDHIL